MGLTKHYFPPEWQLARKGRNESLPRGERMRRIKKLPQKARPEMLHQAETPEGSRVVFSGLLPPDDELRLRLREVRTMWEAGKKEMMRRKEMGQSTEALQPVVAFLQRRMDLLQYERERLKDPGQPVRYRYLKETNG